MSTTPKRQQIREAVKALLLNATDCGANVYSNRISALWRSEFPCISIFANEETTTKNTLSGKVYVRTGSIVVQVITEATENLDNELDKIADQIEGVIEANHSLSGTVQSVVLQSTELELNTEAAKPLGSITLVYEIKYIK